MSRCASSVSKYFGGLCCQSYALAQFQTKKTLNVDWLFERNIWDGFWKKNVKWGFVLMWCRVLWVWAAPCWTMGLTIWLDLNRQDSCGQIPSIVLVVIVLYFTVVVARMVCSWPYIPPQQKIIISEYTYARKNKRGSLRCVKKRPKPYGTLSVISAHMWRLPCNNSTQNKHITFWVDTRGAFAYQK